MPELPEVETVRRGLTPAMEGFEIMHAEIRRPDLRWPLPDRMAQRMTGARVDRLGRRSKVLLVELSTGETLLWHLGMSGRVLISGAVAGSFHHDHPPREPHHHVVFHMANGGRITFNDPRRFGAMDLTPTAELPSHKWLVSLGPEPLGNGFDGPYLAQAFVGRKTPVKAALLDQKTVAGLGNIYVSEALFRAGVSPKRHAGRIAKDRVFALVPAIRDVLTEAIEAGGRRSAIIAKPLASLGIFSTPFGFMTARARPARHRIVRARCGALCSRGAQASIAPSVKDSLNRSTGLLSIPAHDSRHSEGPDRMAYETLIVDIDDHVATIKLNRPDALNALNGQLLTELVRAVQAAEENDKVRVIVLTGSEKAFAAGADVKEMADRALSKLLPGLVRVRGAGSRTGPQTDDCGCRGLCPWWRMRACHAVRFHHRRGQRAVRPT